MDTLTPLALLARHLAALPTLNHMQQRAMTCPNGHYLAPGRVLVGWSPCNCPAALEHYRGHRTVRCRTCEDEGWTMARYIPEHLGSGHPGR